MISHLRQLGLPTDGAVVDVGCGQGEWLREMGAAGASPLVGVDGPWNRDHHATAAGIDFVPLDLGRPRLSAQHLIDAVGGRRFDLALCTEVVEHLPEPAGAAVVEMLTAVSDVVVFSAAVPGQGGRGHRNERWQSEWARRFVTHGFEAYDLIRPKIWADGTVERWYRQNLVLYAAPGALPGHAPTEPSALDLVHPELFEHRLAHPRARDWARGSVSLVVRAGQAALKRWRR